MSVDDWLLGPKTLNVASFSEMGVLSSTVLWKKPPIVKGYLPQKTSSFEILFNKLAKFHNMGVDDRFVRQNSSSHLFQ